jgi:golgin subfamily B member 1
VLELDPGAEPEELARLLEARGDFATLAEVLEIRAGSLEIGDERRDLLLRAAALRAERAEDPAGAATVLLRIREEHGPARDVHALLLPLLEASASHAELAEVLASELELAEEPERPALLSWLADCFLATDRAADALEAFGEVLAVEPSEPRARARVAEILSNGEGALRLRAANILLPVYREEDDTQSLVLALEVVADLDAEPANRLAALAEANDRVEAIGKDKVRMLFLAGRGLREAVAHDVENVPAWLERIGRSENGPSKAVVAETLGSAMRDRAVDHPSIARLAERTGEAYASAGDLQRAIEAYRRVLELEPDNEDAIERIDHLLAEKGSPEERIALYRSSLERAVSAEKKRNLHLAIGGVQHAQLNDVTAAIATYRAALEAMPGDRALRDALLAALAAAGDHAGLYMEQLRSTCAWPRRPPRLPTFRRR